MTQIRRPKVTYRYSDAFKQKIVTEIEKGRLTITEARHLYDINGSDTIRNWIRSYGKNHLINKLVRIEMKDEKDRNKALLSELKETREALSSMAVHNIVLQSFVDVVNENISDAEKKTLLSRLSPEQQKTYAKLRIGRP